jgi:hypothetical protein
MKHHPTIPFWPCIEKEYRIMEKRVSELFMAQKMMSRAGQKHPFTLAIINRLEEERTFSYFKAKMAFLFGCAAGELSFYTKSLKNVGATPNKKEDFMKEVACFLEKIMVQCLKFDWKKFLLFEKNLFLKLSFTKLFFLFWFVCCSYAPLFCC